MRQVLSELFELLTEQKAVLSVLLMLSEEERQVIVKSEPEKLEAVIRAELKELSKLGAIEKKRKALHPAIGKELGIPDNDITIGAIASNALPDERETISKLQAELTELIDRHTKLNLENRELIEDHLEYTEAVLELMVDSEDPLNNFYGVDGKAIPERKKSTGFFDGRA